MGWGSGQGYRQSSVFGCKEERKGAIARGEKLRDCGRVIKVVFIFIFFILTALLRND